MRLPPRALVWLVPACAGPAAPGDQDGADPIPTEETDVSVSDTGAPGGGGDGHVTTCGPIVFTEHNEADLPAGTSWPALSAATGTREAVGTLHTGATLNVEIAYATTGSFRHGVAAPLTPDAICYDQWDAQVRVSASAGEFAFWYTGWLPLHESLPLGLGNHFERSVWPAAYGLPAAASESPRIYMDIHWPTGAGLSGGFRAEPNVPPANGDDGFVSVLSF